MNVTNETYVPISNASINLTDTYNHLFQNTTGANGLTDRMTLLEFNQTSSGQVYLSPYTITVSKTGYATYSSEITLNHSFTYDVVLGLLANETQGRSAIEEGIDNIIPTSTVDSDFEIDIRYFNGNQATGVFDKIAFLNNQMWAFNYVTTGENFTNMNSSSYNIFNVWENSELSYDQIVAQVEEFINESLIEY